MNTRSTVFALGVATLFLLVLTDASYSQDKVVRIGGLFPTSGPGAYFGMQDKQGIDLAVEQINKGGGIVGRPGNVLLAFGIPDRGLQ